MKYISTRGKESPKDFSDVLLMGLATDGGLMMPEKYPQISTQTLASWRNLTYPNLAFELMRLYIADIDEPDLKSIIDKTYTEDIFNSKEITPVRKLNNGLYILALSNGPTLAFKDIAMQFLGNVFEYILTRHNKKLNILGATSGDTGSAAEYAMRSKNNIQVFMLSPNGKMSEFQRAQMYSLQDTNIHNIAIEGLFDDCQDMVKDVQADLAFKQQYHIGTVNSINWGRILAQIVYYFKAYFAVTDNNQQKVSFCVPSGNFGDVCAAHIAKSMGLPINRLIVATNENNVLEQFFLSGKYQPRSTDQVHITSSPSMDIAKASNLERFVFDLVDRDAELVTQLWEQIRTENKFDLTHKLNAIRQQFNFYAGKSSHRNRLETIRATYFSDQDLIDPHTADGVYVASKLRQPDETIVCLETALPAKFSATIHEALGDDFIVPRPKEWELIETKAQKFKVLNNQTELVKNYIKEVLS